MTAAWQLDGLVKTYTVGRFPFTTRRAAVRGISLQVEPGERVALVGPSGSGKSSVVRCGLGLLPADDGEIHVLGQSTAGWRPRDWRAARRRIQILFQDPGAMLHPDAPVGALLADSAALHRPDEDPDDAARAALASVGLAGRGASLPRELSGGEQRRVGLARVLLAQPALLVADEPTSGLDAAVKRSMMDLLLDRVGTTCAVVLVSHDLSTVAQVCDRVLVIEGGQVVERFATASLRQPGWSPSHGCTTRLLEAAGWTSPASP